MTIHRKAYRFRMRPTKAQEAVMLRTAGACRFVWNWALGRRKDHYEVTGKHLSFAALSAELTQLRKREGIEWLAAQSLDTLRQPIRDQDRAFTEFFQKRARYPKFKSRKRTMPAFRAINSHDTVRIENSRLRIPKLGFVKIRQSQTIDGKIKSASVKRDTTGKWHVALLVEFEMPDVELPAPDPKKIAGIDLGLTDFAVLSTGERIEPPRFFRKAQKKLRQAQRTLSRRKADSRRREKAKMRVAKIHLKAANQRSDFLHKLSADVIRRFDAVCLEDLNLKGLARTKLAKSFQDAAHGEFRRQVTYKAEWNRKHVIVIDRFEPSSKRCHVCREINDRLTLKDRKWTCPGCGTVHDRDLNAARNIEAEGLRLLAVGNTDNANARGARVRPPLEAVGDEAGIAC